MASADHIRKGSIDKILSIKVKEILQTLDQMVSAQASENNITELSTEQKAMLEMSERDIKNGDLISQDAMTQRNLEWLNAK